MSMSIEGLGKKFQEARIAKGFTLDEAARLTKIRPSRLAEIEAGDFSQFPSLAYAKGFLLIYGKFLDVDVTEYLDAFETPSHVTIDGYSYLQEEPARPARRERAPVIRHRRVSSDRSSPWPLLIAIGAIVIGFLVMRLFLNLQRIGPRAEQRIGVAETSPSPSVAITQPTATLPPPVVQRSPAKQPPAPVATPAATAPPQVAIATPPPPPPKPTVAAKEPEIRRAEPVRPEDLAKASATTTAAATTPATTTTTNEGTGPNRVAIKPLKKTYIKVTVDNDAATPSFERWISPSDGIVEFHGQHIAVRVLERDAIQIKKNGKPIAEGDTDVTVE
jgi:cytoskeletal protein RodZ